MRVDEATVSAIGEVFSRVISSFRFRMGKSSKSRDRSPSVQRLRKKFRKLQERIEWRLDERKVESPPRVGGVVVGIPDKANRRDEAFGSGITLFYFPSQSGLSKS